MFIKKNVSGVPDDKLPAYGLLHHDPDVLSEVQKKCMERLTQSIRTEDEAYLISHPEIDAMMRLFVKNMIAKKRPDAKRYACEMFSMPAADLDTAIRRNLNLDDSGPYYRENFGSSRVHKYEDHGLEVDLDRVVKESGSDKWVFSEPETPSSPTTMSSSFLSLRTSDTTLPTPEPIPTPEPTIEEIFFAQVSYLVDKAVFLHVDDGMLRYDTAYVRLTECIEEAMEITVIEIKEDIVELFYNAYKNFELIILEKERIAAELAWERRMRKKLKKTLRIMRNFKGYDSQSSSTTVISDLDEPYKVPTPPPKPCVCSTPFSFNRYPKDRFGVCLPRNAGFRAVNCTTTPLLSDEEGENITEVGDNDR